MKIDVIINGASRKACHSSLRSVLQHRFDAHDLAIHYTDGPKHATELARVAADNRADVVIAVGGDGTVNETLNGIIGTDTRLAVIPAGTANDLAAHFDLPVDIARACDAILNGRSQALDVIRVNNWHYLTTGGIGLPCDTLAAVDQVGRRTVTGKWFRAIMQSRIYILGVVLALLKRRRKSDRINISFGREHLETDALLLTLSNLPVLGRRFSIAPQAKPDDGLLDLCVIDNRGLIGALMIAARVVSGRHTARPGVRHFRTSGATITTNRPVTFFGDGELREAASEFDVEILPRSIRLIIPDKKKQA